jgi:starvation-inducible DNA-binding protein
MDQLVQQLLQAFANNFTFYLKSHNYHWSVSGPDFVQYHKFLEEIYDDAQDNIDTYAEKIRQIGAYPEGDYRDIMNNTQLMDPVDTVKDPMIIFANLMDDIDVIVAQLQTTYDTAGEYSEYGIQNFLADRIDAHRQQAWMIQNILGGE